MKKNDILFDFFLDITCLFYNNAPDDFWANVCVGLLALPVDRSF